MHCPFCGHDSTRVADSRLAADGSQVRRRRACPECGERFTTFELAEVVHPRIVKKDGTPEPYNQEKLREGIDRALYKRPVDAEAIEACISHIEARMRAQGERDVASRDVGEWVMDELRRLDQVAYVRFASVYREFDDVSAIRAEIDRLEAESPARGDERQLSLIDPDPIFDAQYKRNND